MTAVLACDWLQDLVNTAAMAAAVHSLRLEAGDPVDSKHPVTGESALPLAAQRCDFEAARLLVQSGADPVGSGALRKAIDLQDFTMARALLKPLPVFDQLC